MQKLPWPRFATLALLVLVALAPISLSFAYAYRVLSTELLESSRVSASAKAHIVSAYIDGQLGHDMAYVDAHADRPSLHDAIRLGDQATIQERLGEILAGSNRFAAAVMVDRAGTVVSFYPEQPETIGADLSDQDWFVGTSQTQAPYVSDFFVTRFYPVHYTFVIGLPIFTREKELLGFVGVRMVPGYLDGVVAEAVFPDTTTIVVDESGYLVYHPEREITTPVDVSHKPAVQRLLAGVSGAEIFAAEQGGQEFLTGYYKVNSSNWGVILEQPLTIIMRPLRGLSVTFFLLGIVGALLAAYVGNRLETAAKKQTDATELLRQEEESATAYSSMLVVLNRPHLEVSALCTNILLELKYSLGLDLGVIYVANSKELLPVASLGLALPVQATPFAREAVRLKTPFSVQPIPTEGPLVLETAPLTIRPQDIRVFPLLHAEEPLGAIEVASVRGFREQDLKLLHKIAPQLAISIANMSAHLLVTELAEQLKVANEGFIQVNNDLVSTNSSLREYQHNLLEANQKLDFASKAKSDFLANVSHELRTPLNSVLGFTELLQDQLFGPVNDKQAEYLTFIYDSGKHLLSVINDILDVAKVESGKMELEATDFSLNTLLANTLALFREKASKHHLKLNLLLGQDLSLEADERKVKQIMFNLLSNAVKFTHDGGEIQVKCEVSQHNPGFVEVSVRDTGIGVKAEDLPKLFGEFTQLESSYERKYQGTGLGLAITKKLVEMHGGTISVESIYGQGSTFSFVLPLTQQNIRYVRSEDDSQDLPSLKGKKIVIVDDNVGEATLAEFLFAAEGALCSVANDAKTGIAIAASLRPDVIVLDLLMPDIDGYAFLRFMQEHSEIAHTPVVVLTGMALSKQNIAELKQQVYEVVRKGSLERKELVKVLRRALIS